MAEPIGVASGILALAVFAFKSGVKLRDEIASFKSLPSQARELLTELTGLVLVLRKLSETGNLGLDVDLSALKMTLEQCQQAFENVRTELQSCFAKSGSDRTSFRGWLKLKCSSGDGIAGFRQELIGYKSTINVALSFATLLASSASTEAIQACRDSIATSTMDLEAHLEDILQKLESLATPAIADPNPDAAMYRHMENERLNTEKALQLCSALSNQLEQIQAEFHAIQDPESTSGMLFGEGLDGCMHHMRFTLAHLERHQKNVRERPDTDSNATSKEGQASFDKLQNDAKALRRCLAFCSDVDTYVESQISNIENHAEGDDTIQFMVSTDGKPLNGKNHGKGQRQKQAGGHLDNKSLQQMSQDFKSIALYQTGRTERDLERSTSTSGEDPASSSSKSPFGDRHGPGFTLVKTRSSC
ncbi:hypothetical protein ACHAPJ_011780 [Fusarium lateritium]